MAALLDLARLARRTTNAAHTLRDYARDEVRESRPSVLILAPAARCNATCTFCFDYKRVPPQALSLSQFETLVVKLSPHLEMVDFSYLGEPLLNPDVPAMIAHAKSRGIGTILYTNGILLEGERGDALAKSGVDLVVVNLNAWTPDYRVDDPGVLPERRVRAVDRFVQLCLPGTRVVLQVIAKGGRASFSRAALAKRFARAESLLFRVKREERYSYDGPAKRPRVRCFRPFEEITVAPNGDVVVCCKDMLRKTSFGNLLTDDLETIWLERMNALRRDNREDLCVRCESPGDPKRFLGSVALSPIGARRAYLRAASRLF